MSFNQTAARDILRLILNATAWANVADNAASGPFTNLYVSLHTADVGETGAQTANEASYTGYARIPAARTSGGWTITNDAFVNAAEILFGTCTAGPQTITHFAVGTASSGAGTVLLKGALAASLSVTAAPAITPRFAAGALSGTLS
jgi:hypothetical protein